MTQYDMRKEGDKFKIGDSVIVVDHDGDITINEKEYRDPRGCGNYSH